MIRLAVTALAATRLTRALQHEEIGRPFRNWTDRVLADPPFQVGQPLTDTQLRDMAVNEWFRELLGCDHCFGFWVALGMSVGWKIPGVRTVVYALAAAAVLSAVVDHYPGWAPED